jgi:hypothetical protein
VSVGAPVRGGLLVGFGNQSRREAETWVATGRWRRQALAWTAILAGLFALMWWILPAVLPVEGAGGPETVEETAIQFTQMAALVSAVGVVLLTAGVIIDERRDGVLEWLLSKPLTRPALIAAKFVGHSVGVLVAVVLVPWVAVYGLLSLAAGGPWHPGHTTTVAAMVGLFLVFHLALVLAISTFTAGRVAVLAVPLVLIVGADAVPAVVPAAFDVLPWSLGRLGGVYLAEGVLVTAWPLVATVGWTAGLLAVAMWRLTRTEF